MVNIEVVETIGDSSIKFGDYILIKCAEDTGWDRRIFVKWGSGGRYAVIVVTADSEEAFKMGRSFDTTFYPFWQKEILPQIVPFSFKDASFLIGMSVRKRYKPDCPFYLIVEVNQRGVCFWDKHVDFSVLLNEYQFLDGTWCGKKV